MILPFSDLPEEGNHVKNRNYKSLRVAVMAKKRIIIIGGGAAGLLAAGRAAQVGAEVLVLEKMKRPGRKICISGKGRCNITNTAELHDFIGHFGKNGRFLHQAFNRFFRHELLHLFEQRGLAVVTERGGRVFPESGKAPDVYKTLHSWLKELKVRILCNAPVTALQLHEGRIRSIRTKQKHYDCDAAILATGGASYSRTGSTGDGYGLAKSVGHSIVPIRPALIPLITKEKSVRKLEGLSLRNTAVHLFIDGKQKKKTFGELLFTHFGLSGPVILTLSDLVVTHLRKNRRISLKLDLKPALDDSKFDKRLLRDFQKRYHEPMFSVLRGLLPREMIEICLEQTNIKAEKPAGQIRSEERKRLRHWMKNLTFEITGHRPLEEAIVTAGGVSLKEIEPRTMQSKKVCNLYIAGELLDLHGDTGGYNLQAAFSMGWLAGDSAASQSL